LQKGRGNGREEKKEKDGKTKEKKEMKG